MKLHTKLLQKYGIKLVWLISLMSILWIAFLNYQTINEAILDPPIIEQQQLSARQSKINMQLYDTVTQYHGTKIQIENLQPLNSDPFESTGLDTTAE